MHKAIALLAALIATSATAEPRPWHLRPDGYGPARIGMTRPQVERALATRLQGEPLEPGGSCIEATATRGYPGLVFMFVDRRLSRIAAVRESRVTTPRGIGLGASADAVRRAYGPRLRAETHHYMDVPAEYLTFWVRPGQRGVRFETSMERRVDTILAGNDTIQYIEGCA